jgi:large subunit ribosomal protein L9
MRKLLLKGDVPGVGQVGDILDVNEGFARNYLIPQGLAIEPTPTNIKKMEEERKVIEVRRAQELAAVKAMAEKINGVEITIVSKANEQGNLFGSIGPQEISAALREEGYNVDAKNVILAENLKQVEKYSINLSFAPEVTATITVWVAPTKDGDQENKETK